MYEELDVVAHRAAAPPLLNAITELPRTLLEFQGLLASLPLLSRLQRGDAHPVLVLPGFLAGDDSTAVLRRFLGTMNYQALPWQLGRNTGQANIMQSKLLDRFESLANQHAEKITIIGQSLGGVYARELARMYPDSVRQVITLGSPFGTRDSGTTLPLVRRLFEQQSGMTIEAMREFLLALDPHVSPPVPVTAIYSKGDGVVNWRVCLEHEEDELTQNIEVCGSHCGMGFNPAIYYIVADRLAQPLQGWQKFEPKRGLKAFLK
ncbi:MAG: alpha/beta hydrolase [Pseudomonadota bacterium]